MPRKQGPFPSRVTQLLLSLRRRDLWEILDALQRLCNDPNLLALQEEDGQAFLEVAGYVLLVDVDDDTITIVDAYKQGAS